MIVENENKNILIFKNDDFTNNLLVELIIKIFEDNNYCKIEKINERNTFKRYYKSILESKIMTYWFQSIIEQCKNPKDLNEIIENDTRTLNLISPQDSEYENTKTLYEESPDNVEFFDKINKNFIIRI